MNLILLLVKHCLEKDQEKRIYNHYYYYYYYYNNNNNIEFNSSKYSKASASAGKKGRQNSPTSQKMAELYLLARKEKKKQKLLNCVRP